MLLLSFGPKEKAENDRNRAEGHEKLFRDYSADNATYEAQFRRRYRMSRRLFDRICSAVTRHDQYFVQKQDATERPGLSPLQKITAALRMLTNGSSADACDESVRIGETTVFETLRRFVAAIIELFHQRYLRSPNADDVEKHLEINRKRGFPGMFGSLNIGYGKTAPLHGKGTNSTIMDSVLL